MKLHVAIIAFLLAAGLSASAADRPNVIFFAVDDLCDWVGPMGYEQAITPHMDQLARRGVVFSNAHCPGTFCAPSRSAIFTGRYASSTGCYTNEVYFHEHPDLRPLQLSLKEGGTTGPSLERSISRHNQARRWRPGRGDRSSPAPGQSIIIAEFKLEE